MAAQRPSSQTTGRVIWEDLKTLLTASMIFCFLPLGIILMWSWGIWNKTVRKVVTVLAILAILAFCALMFSCGSSWKKGCGKGWGKSWGKGCGYHQKWGGHGGCDKGRWGWKKHGKWDKWKDWDHDEWDDDDDDDDDEEDDDDDHDKDEAKTRDITFVIPGGNA